MLLNSINNVFELECQGKRVFAEAILYKTGEIDLQHMTSDGVRVYPLDDINELMDDIVNDVIEELSEYCELYGIDYF